MFDFNIARLFADAAFAKVKNPLRQIPKQPKKSRQYSHPGVRETARRASQIQRGMLHPN